MVASTRSGSLKRDEDEDARGSAVSGSSGTVSTRSRTSGEREKRSHCSSPVDYSTPRRSTDVSTSRNVNPSPPTRRSKRIALSEPVSGEEAGSRGEENMSQGSSGRSKRHKEHTSSSFSGLMKSNESRGRPSTLGVTEEAENMNSDMSSSNSSQRRRLDARTYRALMRPRTSSAANIDFPKSEEKGSKLHPAATEAKDSADVPKTMLLLEVQRDVNEGHSSGNLRESGKHHGFVPPELSHCSFSERVVPADKVDEGENDNAVGSLQNMDSLSNRSATAVNSADLEANQDSFAEVASPCPPSLGQDQLMAPQSTELCAQGVNNDLKQDISSHNDTTVCAHEGICGLNTVSDCDMNEMLVSSSEDDPDKKCRQTSTEASEPERQEANSTSRATDSFHISCEIQAGREQSEATDLAEIRTDIQPTAGDACVECKHPGVLLCCKGIGCRRRYHLSCIKSPLEEFPPGNWYCSYCIRKKIIFGPHALSEGMESVLDARIVCSVGSSGTGQDKEFLVKYEGIAHVHNRWVSEKEILIEAPHLLVKFSERKQKEKATLWKIEWTVPERLLQKRLILPRDLADECLSECTKTPCYYEWLVKWTGLGYEHATWEFENSPFLCTPDGIALIKSFESRQTEGSKSFSSSETEKSRRGTCLSQLPPMPEGSLAGTTGNYLQSVNKLRECWCKGQSLVLLDEEEKIIKVILFLLSSGSDVSSPFLIITDADSMLLWGSEFKRLAPSINIVPYYGTKDGRKMTRNLEFYKEDGSHKFQVLLSLPESIVEDYDALDFFRWEAVIVDGCQHLRVSKHLDQLNKLSSEFRLLLVDGRLADNIGMYMSLISFLESGRSQVSPHDANDKIKSCTSDLDFARDRLLQYVACNRKTLQSKYVEYWVPVELSTVQLEQICANLVLHSLYLRSSAKIDQVGALSGILTSQRKCCDHPYLVDDLLQARLTEGLTAAENLDIGVKASGKLQLLDRILSEMRKRGQRAVVLFQFSGRDGKCAIGDILDDFFRQRFGEDSYERLDTGVSTSKKQTSLNLFNKRENGRFVLLIENRACVTSVRLSSVNAAIIFSGDWNPASDLKALHKIHVEGDSGPVKVFRLYSVFTVEEKALILAKQDSPLDSKPQIGNSGICRSLLRWGASYAFSKLDEFHQRERPMIAPVVLFDKPISDQVLEEVLAQLSLDGGEKSMIGVSMISKCQLTGTHYSRDVPLLGEKELPPSGEGELPSHVFWSRLLEGRDPQWRYVDDKSPRVRRRLPCPDSLPTEKPESEPGPGELSKKCRKLRHINHIHKSSSELPSVGAKLVHESGCHGLPNSSPCEDKAISLASSEENTRDIHTQLKQELAQLCKILQLSIGASNMAQILLQYIIDNHQISPEPETILQAFEISLCWRAASALNQKLDRRASLLLATEHLHYRCAEEEAESVYQKLRSLRRKSLLKDDFRRRMNEECQMGQDEGGILPPAADHLAQSNGRLSLLRDHVTISRIKLVEKISSKRMHDLCRRHEHKIDELNGFWEIQGAKIKKAYEVEQDLILAMNLSREIRKGKLDLAGQKYLEKMDKLESHMKNQMQKLFAMQEEAKKREQLLTESWLAEANAGKLAESFDETPPEDSRFSISQEGSASLDRPGDFIRLSDVPHASPLLAGPDSETPSQSDASMPGERDVMTDDLDARESNEARDAAACMTLESREILAIEDALPSQQGICDGGARSWIMDGTECQPRMDDDGTSARSDLLCRDAIVTLAASAVPSSNEPPNETSSSSLRAGACMAGAGGGDGGDVRSCSPARRGELEGLPERVGSGGVGPTSNPPAAAAAAMAVVHRSQGAHVSVPCLSAALPSPLQVSLGQHPDAPVKMASQCDSAQPLLPSAASSLLNRASASSPHCSSGAHTRAIGGESLLPEGAPHRGVGPRGGGAVDGRQTSAAQDPLLHELSAIRREQEKENEMHAREKQRRTSELEKELEEVRRKHGALIEEAEAKHAEKIRVLAMIYDEVYLNWLLAGELSSGSTQGRPPAAAPPPPRAAAPGLSFISQLARASQQQYGHRHGVLATGRLRPSAVGALRLPESALPQPPPPASVVSAAGRPGPSLPTQRGSFPMGRTEAAPGQAAGAPPAQHLQLHPHGGGGQGGWPSSFGFS